MKVDGKDERICIDGDWIDGTDRGFIEVDDTNRPGRQRLDAGSKVI